MRRNGLSLPKQLLLPDEPNAVDLLLHAASTASALFLSIIHPRLCPPHRPVAYPKPRSDLGGLSKYLEERPRAAVVQAFGD